MFEGMNLFIFITDKMGLILLFTAYLLSIVFMPFGIVYTIVKSMIHASIRMFLSRVNSYFKVFAVCWDQMGNVVIADLFNDILIKKDGHKAGNEDETISSVLGKNKQTETLTLLGRIISTMLNHLDKNHVEKSIENVNHKTI